MPKQIDWDAIEQAYMHSSDTLEEVAAQFGVSDRAIKGKASEGNWSNRRKAQKVVPIGEGKAKARMERSPDNPTPIRSRRKGGEIDEMEIVDSAIVTLDLLLSSMGGMSDDGRMIDTRGIGGTAGALCKLIELRLKLKPRTAAEVAEMAIALNLKPHEFVNELRERWENRA